MTDASLELSSLTADIVAAYVSHNAVRASGLGEVIAEVGRALGGLGQPVAASEPQPTTLGKVEIRKSISPDHLTSFLNGRPYKSLKLHLTSRGMTPRDYRTRFGLPDDYPMVALSYSARRAEIARSVGLGRKADAPVEPPKPPAAPPSARKPRRKQAEQTQQAAREVTEPAAIHPEDETFT